MRAPLNSYAAELQHQTYADIPKSVFAALAVSYASNGGESLKQSEKRLMAEWWTLYRNGIVTQKPFGPEIDREI